MTINNLDELYDKLMTDLSLAFEPLLEEILTGVKQMLTLTPAEILAVVSQTAITQVRGNTWEIELTDLTLGGDKQQFAIKRHASQRDAEALLFIDTESGLLVVNGDPALDAGQATLSYTGTTLTITLEAEVSAQLPVGNFFYGIQGVEGDVITEPYGGVFTITADVVRATE